MLSINHKSPLPLWEQIYTQLKKHIFMGVWSPGEQIPSVRSLALELGINPNTIQKAIGELEREGLVYSISGKGSFVEDNLDTIKIKERGEILKKLDDALLEAVLAGIEESLILDRIQTLLKKGQENDKN